MSASPHPHDRQSSQTGIRMAPTELKIDWLFRLKRNLLLSILAVLAVTITVTMLFIAIKLRSALEDDSKVKTRELATTILTSLNHLMLLQATEIIQETLEETVTGSPSVEHAYIINGKGEIVYSSEKGEVGTLLDRQTEETCRVCHDRIEQNLDARAVVLQTNGSSHRNITLIANGETCQGCHADDGPIIGKLIIDRSLAATDSLITGIELIIFGSGLVCLVILVPLFSRMLSKGINRYILEIFTRNEELRLLYVMVERLSMTLDMELLKEIVIEIFRDILEAEEVSLCLARGDHDFSSSSWSSATGRIERCKISADGTGSPLQRWLRRELEETEVAADGRGICMPISKGGHRLALIVARRNSGQFNKDRLRLGKVISGHIASAFENARLYYIAITDELTGTFTKRHFRQCIGQAFADYTEYGGKFALLMMDLDRFKQVNDNHGHVAGDAVLHKLGELIRLSIRDNDLAFRYGGEEFAVILPSTALNGASQVAERIRSEVEQTVFEPGDLDLRLTISIGIATCPGCDSIRELVVSADRALYAAKHQGRNRVMVAGGLDPSAQPSPGTEDSRQEYEETQTTPQT